MRYFQALMMPSWLQESSILSLPCTDDQIVRTAHAAVLTST